MSTHFSAFRAYKVYKASNKYSHSHRLLFFAIGTLKNICQLSALAVGCWLLYTAGQEWINQDTSSSPADLPANSVVQIKSASPISLATESAPELHEAKWVFRQPEDKYTIQFVSSADIDLLYKRARSFPNSDTMAVYPFKKDRNNQIIYGFSVGLYDNLKNAQEAISKMPEEIRESEPWIRSIGELQIQVARTLETS